MKLEDILNYTHGHEGNKGRYVRRRVGLKSAPEGNEKLFKGFSEGSLKNTHPSKTYYIYCCVQNIFVHLSKYT